MSSWTDPVGKASAITKLLIANRGEIACRVNRAARKLGLETVQVVSEADTESLAARLADEVKVIGKPQAAKSYLDAEAILSAARDSGADAVHPGYGFLSENADFADAVEQSGLIFVGPTGDTIRLMGNKVEARAQARGAGVPTVPGSDGVVANMDEAATLAGTIGFPVVIKASAGGGGRGIRVASCAEEFRKLAPQASSEAAAAFGDSGIYVEKLIEKARHIEVQVLGDGRDVVHFFRTRMLAPAAAAKGLGGSAIGVNHRHRTGTPLRFGRKPGKVRELPWGRDGRVPLR